MKLLKVIVKGKKITKMTEIVLYCKKRVTHDFKHPKDIPHSVSFVQMH